jgi:hypothetical protein
MGDLPTTEPDSETNVGHRTAISTSIAAFGHRCEVGHNGTYQGEQHMAIHIGLSQTYGNTC